MFRPWGFLSFPFFSLFQSAGGILCIISVNGLVTGRVYSQFSCRYHLWPCGGGVYWCLPVFTTMAGSAVHSGWRSGRNMGFIGAGFIHTSQGKKWHRVCQNPTETYWASTVFLTQRVITVKVRHDVFSDTWPYLHEYLEESIHPKCSTNFITRTEWSPPVISLKVPQPQS